MLALMVRAVWLLVVLLLDVLGTAAGVADYFLGVGELVRHHRASRETLTLQPQTTGALATHEIERRDGAGHCFRLRGAADRARPLG